MKTSRKAVLPAFLITVVVAVALMFGMQALQPSLIKPDGSTFLPDFFPGWLTGVIEGNIVSRILWLIGDWTEGAFLKSVPAALLMLVFTFIAYMKERKKNPNCGTGVGGNCNVWPQMLVAAIGGLILCQLVYAPFFSTGWVPSFTPMCSVAPALILSFGGGVKKTLTSLVLAGLVPFPIAYFIMTQMTDPVGLPGFIAGAFGMVFGTIIATEICRRLPWMKKEENAPATPPVDAEAAMAETETPPAPPTGGKLFVNRLFADSNELVFWGSSYGGFGMYLGAIISWFINPMHGSYASGNFPIMLCAQLCTTALAIFIWYPRYVKNGFAFTFPAIVLTAAIVNTYPPIWQIIVPTVILAAIIMPWLVDWILGFIKYDGRWHVCCFVLSSIGFVCIFWSFFVMNVLMPIFAPVVA